MWCLSTCPPRATRSPQARASAIISPVSGTICAVNEALADAPETLNSDPYGAWIIKVEGIGGTEELLDAAAYEAHCAEEG